MEILDPLRATSIKHLIKVNYRIFDKKFVVLINGEVHEAND